MDVAEFARAIRFRGIRPDVRHPPGLRTLGRALRLLGIELEPRLTRLPERGREMNRRLRGLCRVPRMSSYANGAIINHAVGAMPDGAAYLNIGVWNGFTLLAGMAGHADRRCIGVDNFSAYGGPREAFMSRFERQASALHEFHDQDFRDYLTSAHEGPIGVYVYDGPHNEIDQHDGIALAEPHFADGCVVIVDDTNWEHVRAGTAAAMEASSGSYETLFDVRTAKRNTMTFWNGLMVFRYRRAGAS